MMSAVRERRVTLDPFPPPPGEARGSAECVDCRRVSTMHKSGRCHWCGGWVTELDAASLVPGMVMYDWLDWSTVAGVARDGDTVAIVLEGRPKPVRIGAGSTIRIATSSLRAAT